MPLYHPMSYNEMYEYLNGLSKDNTRYPGNRCGYGIGWEEAKRIAKEEKDTLPEEQWGLITLLTDWEGLFADYPQLKEGKYFSNEYDAFTTDSRLLAGKAYLNRSLANHIFEAAVRQTSHHGISDVYAAFAGLKEEYWAEFPRFAHFAKLFCRQADLPLPIPRTDIPTRKAAENACVDQIKQNIQGGKQPKDSKSAMLRILALNIPYRGKEEAIVLYEDHADFRLKNPKMEELYTVYAHPILTASNVYQLSRNKELMDFLETPEAVKAASEGRLPALAKTRVFDPQAAKREERQKLDDERQRTEEAQRRREDEARRTAEEKAKRGRAVQKKRADDLRKMLERLGVSGDDLKKKPVELKVAGSKAYNNMARAALEAYQSAIGSEPYNIDLDQTVRIACRAYTKGKKSVRTFAYGRRRFEACLDLMMSVSEPDESGAYPEDVEQEFARINAVRKAKRGDAAFVDPRYYKTDPERQVTVQFVRDNLHLASYKAGVFCKEPTQEAAQAKYNYVYAKLLKAFPQTVYGEPDDRALVDKDTLNDVFGTHDKDVNRFQELCEAYDAEKRENEKKAKEQPKPEAPQQPQNEQPEKVGQPDAEKPEALRPAAEEAQQNSAEQRKKEALLLLEEEEARHAYAAASEQIRKVSNMVGAMQAAKRGKENFEFLLDGSVAEKRRKAYEPHQQEIDNAWAAFHKEVQDEGDLWSVEDYLSELPRPDGDCKYAAAQQYFLLGDRFYHLVKTDRREAGVHAAAAFCCRMRFKPNEQVSGEELDQIVKAAEQMDGEIFLRGVNKVEGHFLNNKKTMQAMRDEYNRVVREPYRKPGEEEIQVSVTVEEVRGLLLTAAKDAKQLYEENKADFAVAEQQRRKDFESQMPNGTFVKSPIPPELHEARDKAIRAAIAGQLVEGLFGTSPDAAVDLNKLKRETEAIVKDGELMAQVADREIDKALMDELTERCRLHVAQLSPKADVPRETSRTGNAPELPRRGDGTM